MKFIQLFYILMAVAMVSSLTIPPQKTNAMRNLTDALIYPVGRPTRALAMWAREHISPPDDQSIDAGRSETDTNHELGQLRSEISRLQSQVNEMQGRLAERDRLGDAAKYRQALSVLGTDFIGGEMLLIEPGRDILPGMPVLADNNIIGKTLGNGRVRLVSDRQLNFGIKFRRQIDAATTRPEHVFEEVQCDEVICHGAGEGKIMVNNITLRTVENVQPGDFAILSDTNWPKEARGLIVGVVERKYASPGHAGHAEIVIHPQFSLTNVKSVEVITIRNP